MTHAQRQPLANQRKRRGTLTTQHAFKYAFVISRYGITSLLNGYIVCITIDHGPKSPMHLNFRVTLYNYIQLCAFQLLLR